MFHKRLSSAVSWVLALIVVILLLVIVQIVVLELTRMPAGKEFRPPSLPRWPK